MTNLKKGDVLVWRELKGRVDHVYEDGGADIVFDGSKGPNVIDPGTAALAEVERPILTGAEALVALSEGKELEYRRSTSSWVSVTTGFCIGFFRDPNVEFRVQR